MKRAGLKKTKNTGDASQSSAVHEDSLPPPLERAPSFSHLTAAPASDVSASFAHSVAPTAIPTGDSSGSDVPSLFSVVAEQLGLTEQLMTLLQWNYSSQIMNAYYTLLLINSLGSSSNGLPHPAQVISQQQQATSVTLPAGALSTDTSPGVEEGFDFHYGKEAADIKQRMQDFAADALRVGFYDAKIEKTLNRAVRRSMVAAKQIVKQECAEEEAKVRILPTASSSLPPLSSISSASSAGRKRAREDAMPSLVLPPAVHQIGKKHKRGSRQDHQRDRRDQQVQLESRQDQQSQQGPSSSLINKQAFLVAIAQNHGASSSSVNSLPSSAAPMSQTTQPPASVERTLSF